MNKFEKEKYFAEIPRIWHEYSELYEGQTINEDGIVDCDIWNMQDKKVMFFLKEMNAYNGSLINFLNEGGVGRLWNNTVRWSCAAKFGTVPKEKAWETLEYISAERRKEELKSIAVINAKKAPGKAAAVYTEIKAAVEQNAVLLNRQLRIIAPDIIICGGTKEHFCRIYGISNDQVNTTPNKIRYCTFDGIKVIFYYHPSYYGLSAKSMFFTIYDAIRYIESSSNTSLPAL